MTKWLPARTSIRRRLALSFVTVTLLMSVGSLVALMQFDVVRAQSQHLHRVELREGQLLRVHNHILNLRDMAQRCLATRDASRLATEIGPLRQAFIADMDRAVEALTSSPAEVRRQAPRLFVLETIRPVLLNQADSMLALARAGDWQALELRLGDQVGRLSRDMARLVAEISTEVEVERAQTRDRIRSTQRRAVVSLAATGLLSLLAAAGLGFTVTRSIARPLSHLDLGARALAGGDLRYQVAVTRDDEIASLGRVFNEMASRLNQLYEALRGSEAHFRSLIENASDLITVLDAEGRIVYASPSCTRVTGYHPEALLGRRAIDLVHSDDASLAARLFDPRDLSGESPSMELRFRHRDESWRTLQAVANPLVRDGVVKGVVVNSRDVTEQKRAQEQVSTSLKEKEVLLKEIHHRVKNNLQIISSLLNLQSRHIGDEGIREVFRESQDRVHSLALVHEKLYDSRELARIDAASYVRSLASNLFHSYGVNPDRIRFAVDVTQVELGIDSAVPCGLVLNELVSNALKHAFPDDREGRLVVELRREDGGRMRLRVSDDGIGLPKDVDFRRAESLGLQLVNILVSQLDGSIEVTAGDGTTVEVTFAEPTR